MPELDVSIEVAEAFLRPLVTEWNRLARDDLEALQDSPLPDDPRIKLSFGGAARAHNGYEYLEFHLQDPASFTLRCLIEGTCGCLSFQTHHPVIQVQGDAASASRWVFARAG